MVVNFERSFCIDTAHGHCAMVHSTEGKSRCHRLREGMSITHDRRSSYWERREEMNEALTHIHFCSAQNACISLCNCTFHMKFPVKLAR